MTILPAFRPRDGIARTRVGRRDQHASLVGDSAFAKQFEEDEIRVLQMLEDVEHQHQIELVRDEMLDVFDDEEPVSVTPTRHRAGVSRWLDAKTLPPSVRGPGQM